jgi:hypothetical protein
MYSRDTNGGDPPHLITHSDTITTQRATWSIPQKLGDANLQL